MKKTLSILLAAALACGALAGLAACDSAPDLVPRDKKLTAAGLEQSYDGFLITKVTGCGYTKDSGEKEAMDLELTFDNGQSWYRSYPYNMSYDKKTDSAYYIVLTPWYDNNSELKYFYASHNNDEKRYSLGDTVSSPGIRMPRDDTYLAGETAAISGSCKLKQSVNFFELDFETHPFSGTESPAYTSGRELPSPKPGLYIDTESNHIKPAIVNYTSDGPSEYDPEDINYHFTPTPIPADSTVFSGYEYMLLKSTDKKYIEMEFWNGEFPSEGNWIPMPTTGVQYNNSNIVTESTTHDQGDETYTTIYTYVYFLLRKAATDSTLPSTPHLFQFNIDFRIES